MLPADSSLGTEKDERRMETSLIRLCDAGDETHGTGLVLSDSLAVTCAHVAEACGVRPGGRVRVIFHVNGEEREAEVLLEFWRAPDGDDIAVLRFEGTMPPNVTPVRLGRTSGTDGHPCATLGYPRIGALQGVEGRGEIYRSVSEANGRRLIQLSSKEITIGFSGAPLLDQVTGRVVGMITQIAEPDLYGRMGETAFATPAEVLHQLLRPLCPDLRLHPPQAVEDYLKAVAQFCRDLPYVSLRSDVSLETVYVRERMRPEPQAAPKARTDETARTELAERETRARPMTVIQALEQHPRMVVVGGPGAGKSTLLRHLAQGVAEGTSDWHPHLPILVSLRGLAKQRVDVTTFLGKQVGAELNLLLANPLPENFLIDWARQTDMPWLIALDGLDEIVDEGDRCDRIRELKKAAWPTGSRVLITARPGTAAGLDRFTIFELLPFEPEQVEEFAHNWFKPDEAKARAFLDSLQAARLADVARTPLLLTVAATVFEQSPEASPPRGFRRSRLYGEFVRIVLAEDAAPNRAMKEQFRQQFGTDAGERLFDYRREVLESIALALQEGREVRDALVKCLQQIVGLRDQDAAGKADNVLKTLVQRRAGLVVQRGDRYEFIHPSFREYLAAAALVQACGSDLKKVWERTVSRWREANWREVALFALGILSDEDKKKDVTSLLEQIWNGGEGDLRFAVAALVEQVRVADDWANRVIDALLALVRNLRVDNLRALMAVDALMKLGRADDVVPILLPLARDETVEAWKRVRAAIALGELGQADDAVPILLPLARDGTMEAEVRLSACEALGELGRADEAVPILLTLACDETVESWVRDEAANAFMKLGRADDLLALACDETVDDWVRVRAAKVLGQLGRADDAVPILLALACDGTVEAWKRMRAAIALRELGQADDAVPILLALACDGTVDDWVRVEAAAALGELGRADKAAPILLALACDRDAESGVRDGAVDALMKLGRADDVVPILLRLARDETVDSGVRVEAAAALGELGRAAEAVPILVRLVRDGTVDDWVRVRAAKVLGQLGRADDAVPILLALACDGTVDDWVRRRATTTLGRFGDASVLLDLERIAQQDADEGVRRAAQEAVEQIRQRLSDK